MEEYREATKNTEESNDIIELVNDEGEKAKFLHLASLQYEGKWYAIFEAAEEIEGIEDDEVVIFEVKDGDNGEEVLSTVDDDDILDAVFAEFERMMEEEDDCDCDDDNCGCDGDSCSCGCKKN